jgi:hypothetical protein
MSFCILNRGSGVTNDIRSIRASVHFVSCRSVECSERGRATSEAMGNPTGRYGIDSGRPTMAFEAAGVQK